MYFQQAEHNLPHFHAIYGDNTAEFDIKTGRILDGKMPPKAVGLILEWLELHRDELITIWNTQQFKKIEPLE